MLTLLRNGVTAWLYREMPIPTGSRRSDSSWPKPDHGNLFRIPKRLSRYDFFCSIDCRPGTHSWAFCISRFIENGFATKPRTPGSLSSS